MKLYIKLYLIVICLIFSSSVNAAINETLPSYHWAYQQIEEIQARGWCLDLLQTNKPYTRGEIAKSIQYLDKQIQTGKAVIDLTVKNISNRLKSEFSHEIKILNSQSEQGDIINFRTNMQTNFEFGKKTDTQYRGTYRSGVGLRFTDRLYLYSAVNFDQYDYNEDSYDGYKWRGIAGYTEQAYINYSWKRLQLKIGRDFLKWGCGNNATLILSDISRPMDQFLAAMTFGPFKFTFFTSELDEYPSLRIDSTRVPVKRYLTGHRLDMSLFKGKLQMAISEMLLYGGPNESFKAVYLNPVIFYKGAHKNKASAYGNILPSIELLAHPKKNWQVYGSLLVDDIQLEKTGPSDLEPNELAWLVGTKWADPFKLSGLTLNAEYTNVANRTYKTPYNFETFTHRGKPLGHPLGCDFYMWQFAGSFWAKNNLWLKIDYRLINSGEGSIDTPWDEPWMDYTVKEGYSEPFPTGIVEKTNSFNLQAHWFYNNMFHFYGMITSHDISNFENIKDKKYQYWEGRIRIEFNWLSSWKLKDIER